MKAVFFDKDGTLIEDIPYNVNPALIDLKSFAINCLRELKLMDYLVVMVSNQSGVARGLFGIDALILALDALQDILAKSDVRLDALYYCPHHPLGIVEEFSIECDCRKPAPGMLAKAAADLDIDLSASWMVGDSWSDIVAGNRAGCRTILIGKGNSSGSADGVYDSVPNFVVSDLADIPGIVRGSQNDLT